VCYVTCVSQCQQMNLKLQTVQPEFLAKLLQDVEVFKTDVDKFVDDYTETLVFDTIYRCRYSACDDTQF